MNHPMTRLRLLLFAIKVGIAVAQVAHHACQ
jgi:hypothetical protein